MQKQIKRDPEFLTTAGRRSIQTSRNRPKLKIFNKRTRREEREKIKKYWQGSGGWGGVGPHPERVLLFEPPGFVVSSVLLLPASPYYLPSSRSSRPIPQFVSPSLCFTPQLTAPAALLSPPCASSYSRSHHRTCFLGFSCSQSCFVGAGFGVPRRRSEPAAGALPGPRCPGSCAAVLGFAGSPCPERGGRLCSPVEILQQRQELRPNPSGADMAGSDEVNRNECKVRRPSPSFGASCAGLGALAQHVSPPSFVFGFSFLGVLPSFRCCVVWARFLICRRRFTYDSVEEDWGLRCDFSLRRCLPLFPLWAQSQFYSPTPCLGCFRDGGCY
jgi:hypothetical protein